MVITLVMYITVNLRVTVIRISALSLVLQWTATTTRHKWLFPIRRCYIFVKVIVRGIQKHEALINVRSYVIKGYRYKLHQVHVAQNRYIGKPNNLKVLGSYETTRRK